MWVLESLQDGRWRPAVWLLCGRKYLAGRQESECDIFLDGPERALVSRRQATVAVQEAVGQERPSVTMTDAGTNGAYRNGAKMTQHAPVGLKEGDVLEFGKRGENTVSSIQLRLAWLHLGVLVSGIPVADPERADLLQCASTAGATTLSSLDPANPSRVTHCVMREVQPTLKLITALVAGAHIVTPAWLRALVERERVSHPLPQPQRFAPRAAPGQSARLLDDATLLGVRPERRELFTGLRLVFTHKEDYKRYAAVAEMAGGEAVHHDVAEDGCDEEGGNPRSLVFLPSTAGPEETAKIKAALEAAGKRPLAPQQIASAIISCTPLDGNAPQAAGQDAPRLGRESPMTKTTASATGKRILMEMLADFRPKDVMPQGRQVESMGADGEEEGDELKPAATKEADLIVTVRPPPPTQARTSSGPNYKTFKKSEGQLRRQTPAGHSLKAARPKSKDYLGGIVEPDDRVDEEGEHLLMEDNKPKRSRRR